MTLEFKVLGSVVHVDFERIHISNASKSEGLGPRRARGTRRTSATKSSRTVSEKLPTFARLPTLPPLPPRPQEKSGFFNFPLKNITKHKENNTIVFFRGFSEIFVDFP